GGVRAALRRRVRRPGRTGSRTAPEARQPRGCVMRGIWIRSLQVLGFWRKELVDIVRQPRLIVTLVFGPFVVLLLFGVGYRDTQLDPIEQTAIDFATGLAVDQVNSAILANIVASGQQAIRPVGPVRQAMAATVAQLEGSATGADAATIERLADQLTASSNGLG